MKTRTLWSRGLLLALMCLGCGPGDLASTPSPGVAQAGLTDGYYTVIPFGYAGPVSSFDWRKRHGANVPSSPYYDGDYCNSGGEWCGSGWLAGAHSQGWCYTCGVFAAVGVVEVLLNLYYNQHVPNLDLSEWNPGACYCSGKVEGQCGALACWPGTLGSSGTLLYASTTGIVSEVRSPYIPDNPPSWSTAHLTGRATLSDCVEYDPAYPGYGKIKLQGYSQVQPLPPFWDPVTENTIKDYLIVYGPLAAGLYSMGHAMTLVGFDTQGNQTTWIFKRSGFSGEQSCINSGACYGRGNYLYVPKPKGDISDLYTAWFGMTPVASPPYWDNANNVPSTYYSVQCVDRDGDGFYNWGINMDARRFCPQTATVQAGLADCDDSNFNLRRYSTVNTGKCETY